MSKKAAVVAEEEKISLDELDGALSSLSVPVSRRVNALMNLHEKYLEANKAYQKEVRALEAKYFKENYAPVFAKRTSIIQGTYEPTDEEATFEGGPEPDTSAEAASDEKGIPSFWLGALRNNNLIASQITEEDEDALEYLSNIETANFESDSEIGFSLTFTFAENPYFTNTVLTKKYFLEEDDMFGELILKRAEGSEIKWKPGKSLTVKTIKKKVQGKGKGKKAASRFVNVEEPCESFFNFFAPPALSEEEDEEDEMAIMQRAEQEEILEMDFEIGGRLKDNIIPFSVLWFTGDAAEYQDYEDEDDEFGMGEDDDEEGDDDEDEDDEEDDEEEQPKGRGPRGGKGGKGNFAPAGKQSSIPPPQQPECKQQ